jgi:TonB family protein
MDLITSRNGNQSDKRRFRRVLVASLVFHVITVPPALYVLSVVGERQEPVQRELVLEIQAPSRIKKVERPKDRHIMEPLALESTSLATRPMPILDEPIPDIPLLYERPSVEPVKVAVTPFERPGGRSRAASRTRRGGGPAVAPVLEVQPEPAANPVKVHYPETPPPQLYQSLPKGGVIAGSGEPVFRQDSRDELLRRIHARTHYPEDALELGLEGEVVVRFRLDPKGHPLSVQPAESSGEMEMLEEEAVDMVKEGGPYPVPSIRRSIDIRGAIAYLNTGAGSAVRLHTVRSTGDPILDTAVRKFATADAAAAGPGWNVVGYEIRVVADFHPGGTKAPVIRSVEGDQRFLPVLEKELQRLVPAPRRTGYLRVPILFRIVEP